VNSGMRRRSDCRGALQVTVVTVTVRKTGFRKTVFLHQSNDWLETSSPE